MLHVLHIAASRDSRKISLTALAGALVAACVCARLVLAREFAEMDAIDAESAFFRERSERLAWSACIAEASRRAESYARLEAALCS